MTSQDAVRREATRRAAAADAVGQTGRDRQPWGSGEVKLWKALGVAGLAGVAATGVAVARSERRRRTLEPDEVRARLQERYQEALHAGAAPPDPPAVASADNPAPGRLASAWRRVRGTGRRRQRPR